MRPLTPVASYERNVRALLERVWENLHDWEHLPFLHRSSCSGIECPESGAWGWRPRIGLRTGGEIQLELVLDEGGTRYVPGTATASTCGPGAAATVAAGAWTARRASRSTGGER